jgi:hypothetical protein
MNITSQEYESILSSAPPDHSSQEFIDWMRDNNKVVLETKEWLVVENIKYHTTEYPWYTAFDLDKDLTWEYKIQLLMWEFPVMKVIIHPVITRTVKRFHVHLIRADKQYFV